jgi:hypothetical protein
MEIMKYRDKLHVVGKAMVKCRVEIPSSSMELGNLVEFDQVGAGAFL